MKKVLAGMVLALAIGHDVFSAGATRRIATFNVDTGWGRQLSPTYVLEAVCDEGNLIYVGYSNLSGTAMALQVISGGCGKLPAEAPPPDLSGKCFNKAGAIVPCGK